MTATVRRRRVMFTDSFQDIRIKRCQGVGGVAVGRIGDRGEGSRVHEPILLTALRGERKREMHFPRGNERDLGPERSHVGLAAEALPHPCLVG